MKTVVSMLLVVGCSDQHDNVGVEGTPSDVTIPAGDYAGYRVVMPCTNPFPDVGITGTGGVTLSTGDEISAAGHDLARELADITSIWGSAGEALACEPGVGTAVWLDDWRDVDAVIGRIGAWLVAHDYNLQVGIGVEGVPVPNTAD